MVMKDGSIISVYDCKNKFKEIHSFQVPNIVSAALSPCGTFLQTFQKSSTPEEKNVVLWRTETGDALHSHFQKNSTKATWPSIRFSSDETVACRLATNEIQFFDPKDFSKGFVNRLRVPNIAGFELSALPGSHVAAFVPESKGSPASVQIYHCKKELQDQPVARRSFFRCSTVQLHWNRGSTGLLVVVQADVDKTNQSYYGETKLNYLTTNESHEGLVTLRMF
ncbi:Eukaryotic translation initiation factor 2A [Linum perenne]